MKDNFDHLERHRIILKELDSEPGLTHGAFRIPISDDTYEYYDCIVGDQFWEHVSVKIVNLKTHETRTPTWEEMCSVKELFFKDAEWVVQYHPAKHAYVNKHPHVLHIWRCKRVPFPVPPKEFV